MACIAVGEAVQNWKVGEGVCANPTINRVSGDVTAQSKPSSLGGAIDSFLTEYKVFPAHTLVRVTKHLPYEELPGSVDSTVSIALLCAAITGYNILMNTGLKGGGTWCSSKATNSGGVDHVVEVGGPQTVLRSVNCPCSGVGPVALRCLPLVLLSKAIVLRSNFIGSRTRFEDMIRLINAVKLKPVIDEVFDFKHAHDAYVYQETK
ncbi:hypothetical protein V8D89_012853 [Ganoderma adspersum]